MKQCQNPSHSGPPLVCHGLSMRHDWFCKKTVVDLPIRLKGNTKCISVNSLSPLEGPGIYLSAASQTLLTGVKLHLQCRLEIAMTML